MFFLSILMMPSLFLFLLSVFCFSSSSCSYSTLDVVVRFLDFVLFSVLFFLFSSSVLYDFVLFLLTPVCSCSYKCSCLLICFFLIFVSSFLHCRSSCCCSSYFLLQYHCYCFCDQILPIVMFGFQCDACVIQLVYVRFHIYFSTLMLKFSALLNLRST